MPDHQIDPQSSTEFPALQARIREDLDELDYVADRVREQRSALILQGVAINITQEQPNAVVFRVRPRDGDPFVWELSALADETGTELEVPDSLTTTANQLLQKDEAVTPIQETLPRTAQHIDEEWAWEIPVEDIVASAEDLRRTVVDFQSMSDDDFVRIHHAAQERLGLVGVTHTRGDFRKRIVESDNIRDDLTTAQISVATDVALERYQQIQQRRGGGFEANAAIFEKTIDEVAGFLDITVDDSPHPGPQIYGPGRSRLGVE